MNTKESTSIFIIILNRAKLIRCQAPTWRMSSICEIPSWYPLYNLFFNFNSSMLNVSYLCINFILYTNQYINNYYYNIIHLSLVVNTKKRRICFLLKILKTQLPINHPMINSLQVLPFLNINLFKQLTTPNFFNW